MKKKPNIMLYYHTACGLLIQYNKETDVYKRRNRIDADDPRISNELFDTYDKTLIKRQEFSRLMNIWYANVDHRWKHDHSWFRKLPNFESTDCSYTLGKSVPMHIFENQYPPKLILVYHWGKVYYHTISYNGEDVGLLICPYTMNAVRWAKLKHCAPIFDEGKNKIA